MTDPVNLNHVRKARAKAEAEARAVANRVKHGRTLEQKRADRADEARRRAVLEGARLSIEVDGEGG